MCALWLLAGNCAKDLQKLQGAMDLLPFGRHKLVALSPMGPSLLYNCNRGRGIICLIRSGVARSCPLGPQISPWSKILRQPQSVGHGKPATVASLWCCWPVFEPPTTCTGDSMASAVPAPDSSMGIASIQDATDSFDAITGRWSPPPLPKLLEHGSVPAPPLTRFDSLCQVRTASSATYSQQYSL